MLFQLLQDKQLIIIIFALLFVDCAMMVLWVCVDPMQRQISNLTTEVVLQNKTILKEILTSTWYSNMTTLIGNRKRKTKKKNKYSHGGCSSDFSDE